MPEFTAPGLGRESNHVRIEAEFGDNASGVLYALGGAGGGLSLFMDNGQLVYEYNMMIIERYTARSTGKVAAGKHVIEVDTDLMDKPAAFFGKRRDQGRWGRGCPHDGCSNRAGRVLGQRDLRCRRRPRLAGVAGLLRPAAVSVRRQDQCRQRAAEALSGAPVR